MRFNRGEVEEQAVVADNGKLLRQTDVTSQTAFRLRQNNGGRFGGAADASLNYDSFISDSKY